MYLKRILLSFTAAVVVGSIAAFLLETGPFSPSGWTVYPGLSALGEAAPPNPFAQHHQNTIITIAVSAVVGIIIYVINPRRK